MTPSDTTPYVAGGNNHRPVGTSLANRTPFFRAALALIANADDRLNKALESILEPQGFRVASVASGAELLDRAPAVGPDVVLVNAFLPDGDGIRACRALRRSPGIAQSMPIVVITSAPATKQQRLAALRAGAWDYLGLPLDAEELVLKVETYARVKLELDRVREESPVDLESGLYTARGLERRATELVADGVRRHAAIACVAFGIDVEPEEARPAAAGLTPAALDYVAQLLKSRGRTSDAIGRLGRAEFAVLAPATDAASAVKLARRLALTIESARPRPEGLPPLRVRAGYEAVADLHEAPVPPATLLEHAGAALSQARRARVSGGIRGYQEGAV